ncbi:AraC family transcriptional regulator [Halarcobacter ebronensis]|uniref:AraC family transcriptional regulator n=1 Tax=Halarcobacter ebronensis TaxID=1462615 RepID=A0A4Q1AU06_9BACT|nr:AraC family transcriptional regulator [Halarcobacter ebronensis]QKF81323.1 transcriptional regulator, AraC family [Halarcobacter ebronensis]RXK04888.1 AraC family transcriptional regulator [Halarcobacter ebronensis]
MKLETLNEVFFENIKNSNDNFVKHFHDTYIIGITHDGMFKSINQNRATLLYKNSTRVLNPGEIHCGDSNSWKYTNFYPPLELISEIYEQIYFEKALPCFTKHILEDINLYNLLLKFFISAYSNEDKLEIESNLIIAVSYLIKNYTDSTKKYSPLFDDKKIIKDSVEFMKDCLDTNISLDDLALNSNLSKYHFLRVFKNSIGITPHQFILSQRVQKARELIVKGEQLNQVASTVGFSDQSHFIKNFKRIYGYVPSELKNKDNFIIYK